MQMREQITDLLTDAMMMVNLKSKTITKVVTTFTQLIGIQIKLSAEVFLCHKKSVICNMSGNSSGLNN